MLHHLAKRCAVPFIAQQPVMFLLEDGQGTDVSGTGCSYIADGPQRRMQNHVFAGREDGRMDVSRITPQRIHHGVFTGIVQLGSLVNDKLSGDHRPMTKIGLKQYPCIQGIQDLVGLGNGQYLGIFLGNCLNFCPQQVGLGFPRHCLQGIINNGLLRRACPGAQMQDAFGPDAVFIGIGQIALVVLVGFYFLQVFQDLLPFGDRQSSYRISRHVLKSPCDQQIIPGRIAKRWQPHG